MGVVYVARQENLDREVVVKVAHTHGATEESASRFQREARSLSRLSHPNVVQLFDFGRDPDTGLLFIAMEYIRGTTLARYLKDHVRLTVPEFHSMAVQILAGVAEAHRHGLIHRDLKPSNVMLTSSDGRSLRVTLLDFGLSKTVTDDPLTQVDQLLGSAMYMAPEQLKGRSVDTRADVYALGVLFYQMLTGGRPYPGDDSYQIFAQQVQGRFVPMTQLLPNNHDVPVQLVQVIERCLAVDPEQRPADGIVLENLVATALANTPITSSRPAMAAAGAREFPSPVTDSQMSLHTHTGSMTRSHERPASSRFALFAGLSIGLIGLMGMFLLILLLAIMAVGSVSPIAKQQVQQPPLAQQQNLAAEALRQRALIAMRDKDYELSVAMLTEAVRIAPETSDIRELLAIVMALRDEAGAAVPAAAVAVAPPEVVPDPPVAVAEVRPSPRSRPSPAPRTARAAEPQVERVDPIPDPPASAALAGIAVITSNPAGLTYRLADGQEGVTPARVNLPVGTHPVKLFRNGELVYAGTVKVNAGDIGIVDFQLPPEAASAVPVPVPAEPEPAVVAAAEPGAGTPDPVPEPVAQSPAGADPSRAVAMGQIVVESPNLYGEVLVNGRSYGFPPLKITLPVGPATIQLKSGRSIRRTQEITVREGEARIVIR